MQSCFQPHSPIHRTSAHPFRPDIENNTICRRRGEPSRAAECVRWVAASYSSAVSVWACVCTIEIAYTDY